MRSDRLAKPGEAGATSNSDPRGDLYPRPRSHPAARGFAWRALQSAKPDSQNVFVRWNALECARVRHKSGHKLNQGRISKWATCWKQWWAGTGLKRRHQDFQSYSPGRGSARKCLLSKEGVTTASCAGVRRNEQECAGVGHSLGTASATTSMTTVASPVDPLTGPVGALLGEAE